MCTSTESTQPQDRVAPVGAPALAALANLRSRAAAAASLADARIGSASSSQGCARRPTYANAILWSCIRVIALARLYVNACAYACARAPACLRACMRARASGHSHQAALSSSASQPMYGSSPFECACACVCARACVHTTQYVLVCARKQAYVCVCMRADISAFERACYRPHARAFACCQKALKYAEH